jgi:hypothetical protein
LNRPFLFIYNLERVFLVRTAFGVSSFKITDFPGSNFLVLPRRTYQWLLWQPDKLALPAFMNIYTSRTISSEAYSLLTREISSARRCNVHLTNSKLSFPLYYSLLQSFIFCRAFISLVLSVLLVSGIAFVWYSEDWQLKNCFPTYIYQNQGKWKLEYAVLSNGGKCYHFSTGSTVDVRQFDIFRFTSSLFPFSWDNSYSCCPHDDILYTDQWFLCMQEALASLKMNSQTCASKTTEVKERMWFFKLY